MSFQAVEAVLAAEAMPSRLVLVAVVLAHYADADGGRIRPSVRTIEARARTDRRNVQRYIRELQQLGVLELVRAGGAGAKCLNEYRLNLARLAVLAGQSGTDTALEGGTDTALKGGTKGGTKGGSESGTATAQSRKEIKEEERARACETHAAAPRDERKEAAIRAAVANKIAAGIRDVEAIQRGLASDLRTYPQAAGVVADEVRRRLGLVNGHHHRSNP